MFLGWWFGESRRVWRGIFVDFLGLCVGGKFVILLCIQKTEEIQWVGTEDGWYG